MSDIDYVTVPEEEDFDPQYVPDIEEDDDVEEHPDLPEDLSDFE